MPDKRVVVAMSGGVDSSVAAAFLKEKGYDVIGITIKFWGEKNRCCSPKDAEDARKVARHLNIPHYLISMEESFKKNVVDYFVSEYLKGRTPNPCAVCNPAIKFGNLLRKAKSLGAQKIATGHYAIVSRDKETERILLRRGKERSKDQSYFLARLSQEDLKHTLFPIGIFNKEKIRMLAKEFGLPVAGKKESQEVCFIPDGQIAGFIRQQSGKPPVPGLITDQTGNQIGTHQGITGYTIGQRKGLGIAVGKPVYVTSIDAKTNTVCVGDNEDLYSNGFSAVRSHWISIPELKEPMQVSAKIRYRHKPARAMLIPRGKGRVHVQFNQPQRAITPGQLTVFYERDVVLGSAWIDKIIENE